MGSYATLSSAPLGTAPTLHETPKTKKLQDGQSIVLGEFISREDADLQLSSLLDFMDSSSKLVSLELAHGFDYKVKEEGGIYVVSIEPFVNNDVLNDVLVTVKTNYPEARAGVCSDCVSAEMLKSRAQQDTDQEQEILDNAVALERGGGHIEVPVEENDV